MVSANFSLLTLVAQIFAAILESALRVLSTT